ncbi:MAG: GNAT family N-acetyltransferase [Shewanella sp.]
MALPRLANAKLVIRPFEPGVSVRRAVALQRDSGFEQLGLFRLEIVMGVGNTASEAVVIAAGATFECRARNRIFLHGQPLDAHIYALVPRTDLM